MFAQYDACKDKDIEFCIEDNESVNFDYEPKKDRKMVIKTKKVKVKKNINLGKRDGVIFSKGEVKKDIEIVGGKIVGRKQKGKGKDLFSDVDNSREVDITESRIKSAKSSNVDKSTKIDAVASEKQGVMNEKGKITESSLGTKKAPSASVWQKIKDQYKDFKTNVVIPKYNKLKDKVKTLWGKYF